MNVCLYKHIEIGKSFNSNCSVVINAHSLFSHHWYCCCIRYTSIFHAVRYTTFKTWKVSGCIFYLDRCIFTKLRIFLVAIKLAGFLQYYNLYKFQFQLQNSCSTRNCNLKPRNRKEQANFFRLVGRKYLKFYKLLLYVLSIWLISWEIGVGRGSY